MRLMLEKVEKISKELEKRDTLLENAVVRAKAAEEQVKQLSRLEEPSSSELAPASVSQNMHLHSNNNPSPDIPALMPGNFPQLPYTNPANWEDEDIYMGDNEAEKLKEEKMRRNAEKKGKFVRKGKAPRPEDKHTDDDIESDEDQLEEEKYMKVVKKGKAPRRNEEDSDIIIESDGDEIIDINIDDDEEIVANDPMSSSSFVHPPYRFSNPKGGAGPRLRENPSDGSPSQTSNTIPNPLDLPLDAVAAFTRTILGVMQEEGNIPRRKPTRKIVSEKIKQPAVREAGTRRKKLGVRKIPQRAPTD